MTLLRGNRSREDGTNSICLLIPSLVGGGAERVCLLLANHWVEAGRSVWLVVLKREGPLWGKLDARVKVVVLKRARARQVAGELPLLLQTIPLVPVLVFGFELGVILSALKLLRVVANPVVYREGNDPRAYIGRGRRWLYPAVIRWVDGVLAQSRYARDCLRSLGVDNVPIAIVANPQVVVAGAVPARQPAANRTLRFAAAGRLVTQKGFDQLLEGFCALARARPEVHLDIAGTGPELDHLMRETKRLGLGERVNFAGFVNEVDGLFTQADIFVLSSRFEGQPNALLEALLAGCRVIAAGGMPVRELLEELGLPECWLSANELAAQFPAMVETVLSIPPGRWQFARARLVRRTEMASVAREYWRFVHGLESDTVQVI